MRRLEKERVKYLDSLIFAVKFDFSSTVFGFSLFSVLDGSNKQSQGAGMEECAQCRRKW